MFLELTVQMLFFLSHLQPSALSHVPFVTKLQGSVGFKDGVWEGAPVGLSLGAKDKEGIVEGSTLGADDGLFEGSRLGIDEGLVEGSRLGTNDADGSLEGTLG